MGWFRVCGDGWNDPIEYGAECDTCGAVEEVDPLGEGFEDTEIRDIGVLCAKCLAAWKADREEG